MPRAAVHLIRYKRNPNILGKQPLGPKTQDAISGFWCYRDLMTVNDFGDTIYVGGDGFDRRDDPEDLRGVG